MVLLRQLIVLHHLLLSLLLHLLHLTVSHLTLDLLLTLLGERDYLAALQLLSIRVGHTRCLGLLVLLKRGSETGSWHVNICIVNVQ